MKIKNIRKARVSDTGIITEMIIKLLTERDGLPTEIPIEAYRDGLFGDLVASFNSGGYYMAWIAENEESEPVGFAALSSTPGEMATHKSVYCDHTYIEPKYRTMNNTKKLYAAFIEWGRVTGIKRINMMVYPNMVKVYERYGCVKGRTEMTVAPMESKV